MILPEMPATKFQNKKFQIRSYQAQLKRSSCECDHQTISPHTSHVIPQYIFFRRIFESSLFSAGVVKLRILFWLLKSTVFNYCISKHVFGLQLVYSYQFNYRYVNKRKPIFFTAT